MFSLLAISLFFNTALKYFRTINYLEKPTKGKVIVNGLELGKLSKGELRNVRKSIGMIFQQFNLLNSKTVYDNVAMPLVLNKVPKNEIRKKVKELLEFVEQGSVIDVFGSPKEDITKDFVRTVINDEIPESMIEAIKNDNRNSQIFKLKFSASNASDALISKINKGFNVETNILYATVTELEGGVMAIIILLILNNLI